MGLFENELFYEKRLLAEDDEGGRVSYQDLNSFSEELIRRVGGKKLIFILCENTIGSLLGYLGCLKTGVVPLMLEKQINPQLLARLMEEYCPAFLYVPEDCLTKQGNVRLSGESRDTAYVREKPFILPLFTESFPFF